MKFLDIIAMAAIIGFMFAACDNEDDEDDDDTEKYTSVTLNSVVPNGSATENTSELTLTFSEPIPNLSSGNITLSGIPGVVGGSLIGSGPAYTLPIGGFNAGGSLTVTVPEKISTYSVSGASKTVTIFHDGKNQAITLNRVEVSYGQNGSFNAQLTLYILGELPSGYTINYSGVGIDQRGQIMKVTYQTGYEKGWTAYIVPVHFTSGGTLTVGMTLPTGYTIKRSPQTVNIALPN